MNQPYEDADELLREYRRENADPEYWQFADHRTRSTHLLLPAADGTGWENIVFPSDDANPKAALTDWLNITFGVGPTFDLGQFFIELGANLFDTVAKAKQRKGGFRGWPQSFQLGDSGVIFAVGGQRGTAFLSLSGGACRLVEDWQRATDYFASLPSGRITRWDGAIDDFTGAYGVDEALALYESGMFGSGGNMPSMSQVGNWRTPDGRGRTLNIGRRKNGKMMRVYEKGMQLGARFHPWARWELEWHGTNVDIPWNVLIKPGQYVVGAYPNAMGWARHDADRIHTIRKERELSLEGRLNHLRNSYGPTVAEALIAFDGDTEKLIDRVIRRRE